MTRSRFLVAEFLVIRLDPSTSRPTVTSIGSRISTSRMAAPWIGTVHLTQTDWNVTN